MRWSTWIPCVAVLVGCGSAGVTSARAPIASTNAPAVATKTSEPPKVVAAAVEAEDPGPVEAAIEAAKRDGKPVVLEFSTAWCDACKEFEATVLVEPSVAPKLAGVRFVRYDAEVGSGIAAAERYRVTAFPTFIVLDERGEARIRQSGFDRGAGWFTSFLDRAKDDAATEDGVLLARKRAPEDPKAALAAGRWYVDHGRERDALKQLDDAAKLDRDDALGIAAQAAWQASVIRSNDEDRARTVERLARFVRQYPKADASILAVQLATIGSTMAASDRKALWSLVVEGNKDRAPVLNSLAYDALTAGEIDAARAAAKRYVEITKGEPNSLDTLAEIEHARGDRKAALALEDQALAKVAKESPERAGLEGNRKRFAEQPASVSDGSEAATKRQIAELWKQRASVDFGAIEDSERVAAMDAADTAYTRMLSAALKSIGKRCAGSAGEITEAFVRLDHDADGATKTRVLEPDASAALKTCLETELAKATLPKAPLWHARREAIAVPLANETKAH